MNIYILFIEKCKNVLFVVVLFDVYEFKVFELISFVKLLFLKIIGYFSVFY